jgi:hypothetical protein
VRESDGYDAFISYSHLEDDVLAATLQAGLTRFAKPWYRTRALRVFRDTTDLGATPELMSEITQAMDHFRLVRARGVAEVGKFALGAPGSGVVARP